MNASLSLILMNVSLSLILMNCSAGDIVLNVVVQSVIVLSFTMLGINFEVAVILVHYGIVI
jgi:hypothetical protein